MFIKFYAPTEHFTYAYINGKNIAIGGQGEGGGEWSFFIPVSKGDYVQITQYWSGPAIYWIGIKK